VPVDTILRLNLAEFILITSKGVLLSLEFDALAAKYPLQKSADETDIVGEVLMVFINLKSPKT
jgi:hypothetical protein